MVVTSVRECQTPATNNFWKRLGPVMQVPQVQQQQEHWAEQWFDSAH